MNLKQILNNSKIGLLDKVNFVKTKSKSSEYNKIFNSNRLLTQVLNHNLFPEKIESLKVNEPFQFTNDFTHEFQWIANKILLNIDKINRFVSLKNEFDDAIVKNKYENASNLINRITSDLGFSLWSIESELQIAEDSLGSEENWQKLSDYLKVIQNPFYEFCVNASSKKIEKELSFESYVNQIQNDINTINANDLIKDFFVFNNFKLASYNYDFSDLKSVLFISNLFSLIDQYNTLIDVIIYNLNRKENQYNVLFIDFVSKILKKGNLDYRVRNIYNYLSQEKYIEDENLYKVNYILDEYYKGNFETSVENSKKILLEYPLDFEIYEIYVKSLINSNKDFEEIGVKSIDAILQALFDFLQFKKDTEKHGKKLLKYALKFSNLTLGFQIMDFLSQVDNNKSDALRYSFYSSLYKISLQKGDISISNDLEQFFSQYNFYHYKKVLYGVKNVELNAFTTKNESLKLNAEVTYYYINTDFSKVIELINNRFNSSNIANYFKERYVFLLFNSYLKENRIGDALTLFGTIFFDSETYYLKINFKELFELTFKDNDKFKHVNDIHALILASMYYSEYNLYELLDEYLCSRDLDIKDVIKINEPNIKLIVFLLHKICTIDTIKYYFKCINDAEEFRLEILSTLITNDYNNKKLYNDEIDEINKKISVRNVIKEVNNGRLFVDVDKLKEQLIEKYNDDFNRLIRIVGERKNNNLIGFNASKPRVWEASLKEQLLTEQNNFNDADFIAFKNIYFEVREQFLFSKEYGLDSSLSTKIRHGALENQIRSVFEKLNLVTTKLSGEYIDSEYWNSQNIRFEDLEIIQTQLKLFSKSIDEFTKNLKNNAIQIAHERINNPYALFNYSTHDEILYKFYEQHVEYLKNIDDIVEILLNDLAHYTNVTLCISIYNYLDNEVYKIIHDFVTSFRNNLPKSLPKNIMLFENLSTSLTNLQLCIEDIAEWFLLETSSTSKLLMLEDIINASVEITKQLNTNIDANYNIDMNFKEVSGYSSLIYVFNILFTNAIIHSNSENNIKISVHCELVDSKHVKIDVINTHNITDVQKTRSNLEKIKENWNDFEKIERSNIEGESGFHKIKRIMIYEAKCITEKFDFEITEKSVRISLFLIYKKSNNEDTNN